MADNYTIREIEQQPQTWNTTAALVWRQRVQLEWTTEGARDLIFTGSGSSEYAGLCLCSALQRELERPVHALGGGAIVMHGTAALPPLLPAALVSLARSGDSPESTAALRIILECRPATRHLVITCNAQGRLANEFRGDPRVRVIVLDDRVNDRSLVMTSSFTNIVIAGRLLGGAPDYLQIVANLSRAAEQVLGLQREISTISHRTFDRAVFLGSGGRFGAAREAALKMLEITAGRVVAIAETPLGLRHGPMSAISPATLVVCFVSTSPERRAFELDLIRELQRKKLGAAIVIFGANLPLMHDAIRLECPSLADSHDDDAPVVDVVVGQLLAYYSCLREGLNPDNPSTDGVIHRVVEPFPIHGAVS
jgi:tagatose-6-phosphate ketose/aldose isomerase